MNYIINRSRNFVITRVGTGQQASLCVKKEATVREGCAKEIFASGAFAFCFAGKRVECLVVISSTKDNQDPPIIFSCIKLLSLKLETMLWFDHEMQVISLIFQRMASKLLFW